MCSMALRVVNWKKDVSPFVNLILTKTPITIVTGAKIECFVFIQP